MTRQRDWIEDGSVEMIRMRKTISRVVQWASDSRLPKFVRIAQGTVIVADSLPPHPRIPYRVTYTRNRLGKYLVLAMGGRIEEVRGSSFPYHVCFIPADWAGKRVNRRCVRCKRK